MPKNQPDLAIFPNLRARFTTLGGVTYEGQMRQHPSTTVEGEFWYEGFLNAKGEKAHITADAVLQQRFARDRRRPAYFPPESNVEPLHLKLNRLPEDKRTDKNQGTYIGELFNHEGLHTVVASESKSPNLHMAGNGYAARCEMATEGSELALLQQRRDQMEEAAKAAAAAPKQRVA